MCPEFASTPSVPEVVQKRTRRIGRRVPASRLACSAPSPSPQTPVSRRHMRESLPLQREMDGH
eukprot:3713299-Rhodomonas_salina.1